MKRSIMLILLFALFSGMLTGCYSPDYIYHPDGDYKWVCDKIDMWFVCKNHLLFGELTLNGETKPIAVHINGGSNGFVAEYSGVDDENRLISELLFRFRGSFHEKWFTLKMLKKYIDEYNDEYIDYVGFKKLKFRRVELDEEDRAWREAEYPLSKPDESVTGIVFKSPTD